MYRGNSSQMLQNPFVDSTTPSVTLNLESFAGHNDSIDVTKTSSIPGQSSSSSSSSSYSLMENDLNDSFYSNSNVSMASRSNAKTILKDKRNEDNHTMTSQVALPYPPVNNRNYQEARYKTELCLHFREQNTCPHGDRCLFAHGLAELRPYRGRHPKHKTQLCKAFHGEGMCHYGYRCSYIHSESPRTIAHVKRLNRRAQYVKRNRGYIRNLIPRFGDENLDPNESIDFT